MRLKDNQLCLISKNIKEIKTILKNNNFITFDFTIKNIKKSSIIKII